MVGVAVSLHAQSNAGTQTSGQTGSTSAQSAAGQQKNETQSKPPAPNPKGKVLFERHEAPPADEPAETAEPAQPGDTSAMTGATARGLSSSQHGRKQLRRRDAAPSDAPGEAEQPIPSTAEAAVPSASSSAADIGTDTGGAALAIAVTASDQEAAGRITLAERASVQVVATDLDLHLNTHTGEAEARAQVTVRNNGVEPLSAVPLRISGALHWESARVANGTTLSLEQHHLPDDLDHTGVATELALKLPQPLPPGGTVSLDLYYGGTLAASTQRLTALGAPVGRAAATDWDTVSDTFTGLRGLGDVLWYPVTTPPALLSDGAAVLHAVEASRTAPASAAFRLHLTLAYVGTAPEAAYFCGERRPLHTLATASGSTVETSTESEREGFVTAEWALPALGAHTPSLFVVSGASSQMADGLLRIEGGGASAYALGEAAARLRPMLAEWLGAAPERSLDVIDLPISSGAAFADGALLVAPLGTLPAAQLTPSLVPGLTAAWLPGGIASPWLRDGIPAFMKAVWAQRTAGRDAALRSLAASDTALRAQLPEPDVSSSSSVEATPVAKKDDPLRSCADPACARIRAAYVLGMLRNMLGDAALQSALAGWRVQQERDPARGVAAETAGFEQMVQQVAGKQDLRWFFRDWIDGDRGLPELSIVTIAPRRVERAARVNYLPERPSPVAGPIGAEPVPQPDDPRDRAAADAATATSANQIAPAPGSWLVAVEVQNSGGSDAEVPVTVRSGSLTNTLPLHVPAHGRATVRVPFEADPQEVQVNDGSVPEVRTTTHRRTINTLPDH